MKLFQRMMFIVALLFGMFFCVPVMLACPNNFIQNISDNEKSYREINDAVQEAKRIYHSEKKDIRVEIVVYDGEYKETVSFEGMKKPGNFISLSAAAGNAPVIRGGVSVSR